jgi:hypothetical protein
VKIGPKEFKRAAKLFDKVAREYPRALEQIVAHKTLPRWVHYTHRVLLGADEAGAERHLIKQLHKMTMRLQQESGARVLAALQRRTTE